MSGPDVVGAPLRGICRLRDVVSGRTSSWDRSGRNDDYWLIPAGESAVIADLPGPGTITHLWLTQWSRRVVGPDWESAEPDLLRTLLLRITWDDEHNPAVLVPVGDFFCLGNGVAASFASLPFTTSVSPEWDLTQTGQVALNCYLPMPFARRALVEIVNDGPEPVGQYFHVDFELQREPFPDDVGMLHARWNRDRGEGAWGDDLEVNVPETLSAANLDWKGNYRFLEVEADGQFIGCNLTVVHDRGDRRGLKPGERSWWGEGDDMIVVDGEPWPPRLHGTGSEDYFGHAWEMQRIAGPMAGSVVHEKDLPGLQVSYRFHLTDPVRFRHRIVVSMERGHANHLGDDWSSTAYWYQRLPSPPASVAPVSERLPVTIGRTPSRAGEPRGDAPALPADQRAARDAYDARLAADREERTDRMAQLAAATRAAEAEARVEVAELRARTLGHATGDDHG
jgi:hypothetical protein